MMPSSIPWIELAILVPLLGGIWVGRLRRPEAAQKQSIVFAGLALACSLAAWIEFTFLKSGSRNEGWSIAASLFGRNLFHVDALSGPLLPLAGLLYLVTFLATTRSKAERFSFSAALLSEAVLLATFSVSESWLVIALLAAGTITPFLEMRVRGHSTRVYVFHMAAFVGLLVIGQAIVAFEGADQVHSVWAMLPLIVAVLIRSAIVPVHCWVADLLDKATFGTAILFLVPMIDAYAAARLILPIATEGALQITAMISLFTVVYAAGMTLVQTDARRFYGYLFICFSNLVLVGLEISSPVGLTGALSVWLSVGLALAGFGLTLRALESREGRLSLTRYHGLYEHTPILAAFFLLTGLASVGFPGTFGFVGAELLIDGVIQTYSYAGIAVVLALAVIGIAVVRAYFLLFAGTRHITVIALHSRFLERLAVLALALLILGAGLFPQPGIRSRHRAAMQLIDSRPAGAAWQPADDSDRVPP